MAILKYGRFCIALTKTHAFKLRFNNVRYSLIWMEYCDMVQKKDVKDGGGNVGKVTSEPSVSKA